jgi:3D (Asp-Asp-Asp) domain-containing protein
MIAIKVIILSAIISAYTPSDGGGLGISYSGHKVVPGFTCAVSHDLRQHIGKEIYINGKWWFANDLMGPQAKQAIDLCVATEHQAKQFGKQRHTIHIEQ